MHYTICILHTQYLEISEKKAHSIMQNKANIDINDNNG